MAAVALGGACAFTGALASADVDVIAAVRAGAALHQKAKGDWTPPNPDAPLAAQETPTPCSLPDLLAQAGERAKEMLDNLQSFTARDTLEYEELDDLGVATMAERALFEYAVGFEQRAGGLKVTEARSPAAGSNGLPLKLQDSGLPALALIFHPFYQGDYEMRCEGATERNGQKAWVVHFEQRKDKRGRTRSFRTDQGSYPLRLKGRAWISVDSYQVAQIETKLVAGIGIINLRSDGVKVEYAPVQFASKNLTLWLPRSSESYSDFEKYKVVIKHRFSDYLLSSVQMQQVIGDPKKE